MKKKVVILFLLSGSFILFNTLFCRVKDHTHYSNARIKRSFTKTLKIINEIPKISKDWNIVSTSQFSPNDLKTFTGNSDKQTHQEILQYDPVSFTLTRFENQQGISSSLSLFETSSPLDAWGAYSRLRNQNIPAYMHPLLVGSSEGSYLEGRMILYRGTYLALIDHSITQLHSIAPLVTTLLKNILNLPYDDALIRLLPKAQLMKNSIQYYKKKWSVIEEFYRCAVGTYQPHATTRAFVCRLKNIKESRSAFEKYHSRVQNEMGISNSNTQKKDFHIKNKTLKMIYFFYNLDHYELHGIFLFDDLILGVMGASSQDRSLVLIKKILGNLLLNKE